MIYKRGGWYWIDFTENGRRYRRALKTKNWQEARTEERKVIEMARVGKLADSAAPKQLFEAADRYLAGCGKTSELCELCPALVTECERREFG
jgi:hypothetical protein